MSGWLNLLMRIKEEELGFLVNLMKSLDSLRLLRTILTGSFKNTSKDHFFIMDVNSILEYGESLLVTKTSTSAMWGMSELPPLTMAWIRKTYTCI